MPKQYVALKKKSEGSLKEKSYVSFSVCDG